MTTIYGLKNCDSCRRARRWLDDNGVNHRFHDLRSDGLDDETLGRWAASIGWETLLNRRSTTWRNLPTAEREGLDEARALALMQAHSTLVKRPVLDNGETVAVGFSAAEYTRLTG